jgi:hypothetical protein
LQYIFLTAVLFVAALLVVPVFVEEFPLSFVEEWSLPPELAPRVVVVMVSMVVMTFD